MHTTSPIEKLPAELFLQVMHNLESPIDLRSLISACPPALRYFRSFRYQVLRPTLTRIINSLEDDESGQNNGLIAKVLLAVRLRLAQANYGLHYLERETVKRHVGRLLESPPPPPLAWQGSLAVFCELAHLMKDCEQCISRYASAAWVKLAKETLQATTVWAGPKRPLPLVRFALTPSERRQFQEGFLHFDAYRHCLHYEDTLLLKVRPSEPIQENILLGGTKEGYKEPDWGTGLSSPSSGSSLTNTVDLCGTSIKSSKLRLELRRDHLIGNTPRRWKRSGQIELRSFSREPDTKS
ncbi:hypothetical protein FDECE_9749 [Fusarium decemcellulare]|nr:hypothetical protein FDECE_9749 [Fusarium decemcellulare]